MVFWRKENQFIVKKFWPHRSDAKGFSLENLASENCEKTSGGPAEKKSNQSLNLQNLKSSQKDINDNVRPHLSFKKGHWANRDFTEYKDVA